MKEIEEKSPFIEDIEKLLFEIVVRQSAVENLLIKKGLISQEELASAQLESMKKIEIVAEAANKVSSQPISGFIKYGESSQDE